MSDNKKYNVAVYMRFATKEQAMAHKDENGKHNTMSQFEKIVEECGKYISEKQIQRDREHFKAVEEERREIIAQTSYINADK